MINTATAVAIALTFILAAIGSTKRIGEKWAWVNRKIIHFSIVPAVLMFYWGLIPAWFSALLHLPLGYSSSGRT